MPAYAETQPSVWRRLLASALRDRMLAGLVALASLLALGVNFWRLGNPSIWFDEAYSVQLAQQSLRLLVRHYVWGTEAHMGLYYVMLHFYLKMTSLVGIHATEVVVRLPSALFASLSVVTLFLLGWRYWGKTAAIVATVLYMLNCQELVSAQWARSYALQMLMCVVSWYAFLAALNATPTTRRRWYVAYCLTAAIFVYAQIFSVLVVVAQGVAFAALALLPGSWRERARAAWRPMALSLAGIVVLVAPLLFDALVNGSDNAWITPPTPDVTRYTVIRLVGGPPEWMAWPLGQQIYLWLVAAAGLLAVVAAFVPRLQPKSSQDATPAAEAAQPPAVPTWTHGELPTYAGVVVLACWMVVPTVVAYVATQPYLDEHLFYYRYLTVVVPAIGLLVGIGVSVIRPALPRIGCSAALLVLALPIADSYYQHAEVWDMRTPVQWIEHQYRPGDGVECTGSFVCSVNLEYYLDLYGGPVRTDADSVGKWYWPGWRIWPTTSAYIHYAEEHTRVFTITVIGLGQSEQTWMQQHFRLISSYNSGAVLVNLYDTRSPLPNAGP
jgi:hypothetical protein